MIESLLIANRGEIARRIIRTARRLGIRTIAVYSDADAHALFVREADQAVRIGPPAPKESYLDGAPHGTADYSTASQTAWAVLGLMAAGQARHRAVARGIAYLVSTQRADGTWDEPWFTAVGFPRVFYLRYHGYRAFFPLWALARYRALSRGGLTKVTFGL